MDTIFLVLAVLGGLLLQKGRAQNKKGMKMAGIAILVASGLILFVLHGQTFIASVPK